MQPLPPETLEGILKPDSPQPRYSRMSVRDAKIWRLSRQEETSRCRKAKSCSRDVKGWAPAAEGKVSPPLYLFATRLYLFQTVRMGTGCRNQPTQDFLIPLESDICLKWFYISAQIMGVAESQSQHSNVP